MDPTAFNPVLGVLHKKTKIDRCAPSHPTNQIDMDIPRGCPEHRYVKKKRTESHEHYLAIVRDDNGTWTVRSSDSLKPVRKFVLAESMVYINQLFMEPEPHAETLGDKRYPVTEVEPVRAPLESLRESTMSYPFAAKRRCTSLAKSDGRSRGGVPLQTDEVMATTEPDHPKVVVARKRPRRQRVMLQIRMDEEEKWREWMRNVFKAVQQTACRSIAKEWIRAIHPKKQSTHPYNGNMPRDKEKCPQRTKPTYWPPHIRHKEPDHIDKADRVELLTWLLMATPQPEVVPDREKRSEKSFTAKDLLAVLEQKQDEYVMPKIKMVREVIHVRTLLENYNDGGTDPDATIDVVDWSENSRISSSSKKRKDDSGAPSRTEDEGESNNQDGEDTAADVLEDDDSEMTTHEERLESNTAGPFVSDTSLRDHENPSEHVVRPSQSHDHFRIGASHPDFVISPVQIEQDVMRMNQHTHAMHFHPHHSLSTETHFGSRDWPVVVAPSSNMNGSFQENMMSPVTMMEHSQYEAMPGMVATTSFHDNQHYPFNMASDVQGSFHMANMDPGPHESMQHGFDDRVLYYGCN